MNRTVCCGMLAILLATDSASATLTATFKGSGEVSTVSVPQTGGTYDISVNLTRVPGQDPRFFGFQFRVKADTVGFATLNGANPPGGNPLGVAGNATTGTRYNDPEWSADFVNMATNPNIRAGPLTPIPSGNLELPEKTSQAASMANHGCGILFEQRELHAEARLLDQGFFR